MAFCKHSDFIKMLPCNENNIIPFSLIASVITKGKLHVSKCCTCTLQQCLLAEPSTSSLSPPKKTPPINLTKCFEIKIFTRLRSNLSKAQKACLQHVLYWNHSQPGFSSYHADIIPMLPNSLKSTPYWINHFRSAHMFFNTGSTASVMCPFLK